MDVFKLARLLCCMCFIVTNGTRIIDDSYHLMNAYISLQARWYNVAQCTGS